MNNRHAIVTWYTIIKAHVLDICFPPVCVHCKKLISAQEKFLCDTCLEQVETYNALYCPACGARRPAYNPCHREAIYLLAPACAYSGPIVSLIHAYKYAYVRDIEKILSALAIAHLSSLAMPLNAYTIVPIPLFPSRQRRRGFNQSLLIAQRIADHFHIPCQELLARTKATQPQARQQNAHTRAANVAGCFSLVPGASVAGKKILLVDDVSTSGATLHEASAVLAAHGAQHIIAAVIARA